MVLGASTGALPAARRFPGGTDGAVSWLETGWVAATRFLGDGGDRETPAAAQGVAPDKNLSPGGLVNGDTETCSIGTAISAWLADPTAAEQTYGHVSTWDTSQVTNMKRLFCGDPDEWCYPVEKRYFNDDISAWDTSGVTNMYEMFYGSLYFNQPIGDWDVSNVKSMGWMFAETSRFNQDISAWDLGSDMSIADMLWGAWAFNQDLGWCLDTSLVGGVDQYTFSGTKCASTWYGVERGQFVTENGSCESTPAPTPRPTLRPTPRPSAAPTAAPTAVPTPAPPDSNSSSGAVIPLFAWVLVTVWIMICGGCIWFARRQHLAHGLSDGFDSPPEPKRLEPLKKQPQEEATVIAVAPEAEEASVEQPPPPPAKSWFWRAEPEGESTASEPESIAPKAEEAERPPPLSPFSALRAERERELALLEPEFEPES